MVQEGDKEPYIPKDDDGGGLLDIISFALRVVLWSMEKPRSRNVLVLDEPMKWTGALVVKAGQMMKEISQKLGIQIIMTTHIPDLMEIADRVWEVKKDWSTGESTVTQIGIEAARKVETTTPARPTLRRRGQ